MTTQHAIYNHSTGNHAYTLAPIYLNLIWKLAVQVIVLNNVSCNIMHTAFTTYPLSE